MTISVNVETNANNIAGGGTTITTTLASTLLGDGVVVGVGWLDTGNTITCTVADDKGNTYTAVGSKTRNATQQYAVQLFRCTGTNANVSTVTLTATFSATTTFKDIKVEKIRCTNTWSADALDAGYGSKTGTGNGTAMSTASGTPSENNCAIFTYGAAGGGTVTAGSGFTLRTTGANGIGLADLVQTTAAAKAGLLTVSASNQWGICACAIKDGPAAAGTAQHQSAQLMFV